MTWVVRNPPPPGPELLGPGRVATLTVLVPAGSIESTWLATNSALSPIRSDTVEPGISATHFGVEARGPVTSTTAVSRAALVNTGGDDGEYLAC